MDAAPVPIPVERLLAERAWIARLARALAGDEHRGADLEQDVWAEVLERPPATPPRSLRAWLGGVLRHRAVDRHRSDARRGRREERAARPEREPSADEIVARGELLRRVVAAVMALDEPWRTTVLLHYFEGLPTAAVAARERVPHETVRTRVRRALALLRERLDADHRGDRRAWLPLLLPAAEGPATAPAPAPAAATALTGGAAMAAKGKASLAAAAVLACAAAAWWGMRDASEVPPGARDGGTVATPRIIETGGEPPRNQPAPIRISDDGTDRPRVAVRVLDGTGRPLERAAVALHRSGRRPTMTVAERAVAPAAPPAPVALAAADASGRASLAIPAGEADWIVSASAPGFATASASVRLAAGPSEETLLVLRPAVSLRGTVRTPAGAPAPGVAVELLPSDDFREDAGARTTATDAAGRWTAGGLRPGIHEVRLRPSPRVVHTAAFVRVPDVEVLDLVLDASCGIRGRVLDGPDGPPVAGAEIAVTVYPERVGAAAMTSATALSAADGTFAMDGLAPGGLAGAVARAGGFLPWDTSAWSPAERPAVAPGVPVVLEIRLSRGVEVRGTARDRAGAPVADARVSLAVEGETTHGTLHATTGADGRFSLRATGGRRALLLAAHEGLIDPSAPARPAAAFASGALPPGLLLELPSTGSVERDVVLVPGEVVAGTVRDAEGRPLPGAVVSVMPREPITWGGRGTTSTSAADGTFRVEGVAPVAVATAFATVRNGVAGSSAPFAVTVGAGASGVEVEVRDDLGSVAGRVLGIDGAPVPGVALFVRSGKPGGEQPFWEVLERSGRAVPVAPDGSFRADHLWSGPCSFLATAPGRGAARGPVLDLGAGEHRKGVAVVVPDDLRIEGRVTDAAGAPVAGAGVIARGDAGGFLWQRAVAAVSGADGGFVLRGLAPGCLRLIVHAPGFLEVGADVEAGSPPVTLVLESPAAIAGRILDAASGEPVEGCPVMAQRAGDGAPSSGIAVSGRDGRFRIGGLRDAPHVVSAGAWWDTGGASFLAERVSDVVPGGGEVEIRVARGASISGRLVDGEGRPVAVRLRVFAVGLGADGTEERERHAEAWSGEDGAFRVGPLSPGAWDLRVFPDRQAAVNSGEVAGLYAPELVRAVPAGTTGVVVRVRRGRPISGRVLREDGTPWEDRGLVQVRPVEGVAEAPWLNDVPILAGGMFRSTALRVDRTYDVIAPSSRFPGTAGGEVRGVAAGADVLIVLRSGRSIEGRVVDAAGNPVPARVPVRAAASDGRRDGLGTSAFAETRADGQFTLAGLAPGRFLLSAGGAGSEWAGTAHPEPVEPGGPSVELRAVRGVSVSGRVVNASGEPAVIEEIVFRQERPVTTAWGTDPGEGGTFSVPGFAPGPVAVRAHLDDGSVVDLGIVQAPASDLVLRLPGDVK